MPDFDRTRALARTGGLSGPEITICRGPAKGCAGRTGPCPDCYRVSATDPRTTEEIVAAMDRGDA